MPNSGSAFIAGASWQIFARQRHGDAHNAALETGLLSPDFGLVTVFEPVLYWWFFTITREQEGSKWLRQKDANGLGNSLPR
jgi:hypothetical protein